MEVLILAILLFSPVLMYLAMRLLTAWERRRVAEEVVLGHIASALKQNLPLAPALALAANAEQGRSRLHLQRISKVLAHGAPVSMALKEGFPDCSALSISLIATGEQDGQVIRAAELAERIASHRHRLRRSLPGMPLAYFVLIALCTLSMAGMMMIAVVPKFKEIFKDFDTELPAASLFVFGFLADFTQSGGLAIALVLSVLLMPALLYLSYRPRNPVAPSWVSVFGDHLRWCIPWTRRVQRHQGLSVAMETMRYSVQAGSTLEEAATLASRVDCNVHVGRAVKALATRLHRGEPAALAARACGLGEVAAVALGSGPRHGNLDAGLRYAADYHTAMFMRSWMISGRLMTPVLTLLVAMMAAAVVLAMFMPLVALINSVSGGW